MSRQELNALVDECNRTTDPDRCAELLAKLHGASVPGRNHEADEVAPEFAERLRQLQELVDNAAAVEARKSAAQKEREAREREQLALWASRKACQDEAERFTLRKYQAQLRAKVRRMQPRPLVHAPERREFTPKPHRTRSHRARAPARRSDGDPDPHADLAPPSLQVTTLEEFRAVLEAAGL
jgi:hypothetical protein